MAKPLGKLEPVELRYSWEDEAADFTPWLAQPGHLKLLGDTIGLDLELMGTEQPVGDFSADILARDTVTDTKVLIENQLERTDHGHLGKLITYSSGLGATVVVWIAREIREEHRKALEWLNDVTRPGVNFFGIQIELWRIGNSDPAPRLNVVCQPNDWGEYLKDVLQQGAPSETAAIWIDFWTKFNEYCRDENTSLQLREPARAGDYALAVGRTGIRINLTYRKQEQRFLCQLVIYSARNDVAYSQLSAQKDEIEAEMGAKLEWQSPTREGRRGSIAQSRPATPGSKDEWPELFEWLKDRAEAFDRVFRPRVKALNLEAEEEE